MALSCDRRSVWKQRVAVALVSLLALNPGVAWAGAGDSGAAAPPPSGALSVQSDPAGANVYVDGQLAGHTPLQIGALSPGDHRVRVVKDGYLENARIVNVGAAKEHALQIKLTPHAGSTAAPAVQVSGSGGGGGSKKWLWIGLAGGGAAAAAAVVVLTKNHVPDAGTITVSPNATGMAGVTSFAFNSTASDKDNDSLTYNWNFGDGGTGSGVSPSHVFSTAGTFTVSVAVSDGKETVNAPGITVRVAPSLAGTWTGGREAGFDCGVNLTLAQNGGTLSGSLILTSGCSGTIPLTPGTASPLTHPSSVVVTTQPFSFTVGTTTFPGITIRFSGTTDAAGTVMTGTITTSQSSSGASFSMSTTFRK